MLAAATATPVPDLSATMQALLAAALVASGLYALRSRLMEKFPGREGVGRGR